ncbi:MAG: LacI family DNA-binding transcriptional regulator [Chthonomonas sp.]|nr:LacI family DNA-binding transcriptional regulator [Chthonomonas sp.]
MRITQQDIARIAGVSQATVSRVVGGDVRVESDIRDRVLGAMRDNNYSPDARARSLRQQRTHLIGLVMRREARDLQGDPFFSILSAEILGYLSSTPYHLCVDIAASALRQEYIYDEMLRTRRVDGLILVESEPKDDRIARLQRDEFPFVLIGNPGDVEAMHSVDNDNVRAGVIATSHLVEQGFKRIAFLSGPESLTVSRDRLDGYAQVLKASNLPAKVYHSEFGFEATRRSAINALRDPFSPDALVVLDDFMAMAVADAARELGLAIPARLGLVSFNDTNICHLIPGGLTSVSLNIPEIVRQSCGRLLRIIEDSADGEDRRKIVPTELKVRGSSLRRPEVAML